MTKKLSKHFDMLIVGGGIIGMLTALKLHDQSFNVALIEKDQLGGKATWAAGGILSPLNPWNLDKDAQSLVDEGRISFSAFADELKQETMIDIELFSSGMLVLDTDEKQLALEWAKNNNEVVDVLSNKDLRELEPCISNEIREALHIPSIQQVRPPRLIAALKKFLQLKNISVYENFPVEKIIVENNKSVGISTNNIRFHADKTIICNGAWAKNLFPEDNSIDNIEIQPVRGQMLLFRPPEKIVNRILLKQKSYLIPRQDGHLLCGSTIEHVGFDNDITREARHSLQNIANQLVPTLSSLSPIKQWSALRPGTNRVAPYICEHPTIGGLYLNSGHYRYGIIMSIASARIMSGLVTNSVNQSQIAPFT
jgi:glycine oxidase